MTQCKTLVVHRAIDTSTIGPAPLRAVVKRRENALGLYGPSNYRGVELSRCVGLLLAKCEISVTVYHHRRAAVPGGRRVH